MIDARPVSLEVVCVVSTSTPPAVVGTYNFNYLKSKDMYIQNFNRKPTGKRRLGRPRRRWEYNIRMDLKEIGINTRNRLDSAQDRSYWRALVNAALNLRVS